MSSNNNSNHNYQLPLNAVTYFKKKLVSRKDKLELEMSVLSTTAPVLVAKQEETCNKDILIGRKYGCPNIDRALSSRADDYLKPSCVYDDAEFARRCGLPKVLFKKISADLSSSFPQRWS